MAIRYPVGKPSIGDEEIRRVVSCLSELRLTQGQTVQEFETLFASYVGSACAVACSTGTAGLHLALVASNIKAGDEVLIPDLTYVSTANAVSYTGAKPVLVDVKTDTWNIDLEDAGRKISRKTKAIMPVHVYGTPCDMNEIDRFAKFFNLIVIEDAAEALGGTWDGRSCGTFGEMGIFSFYANKVITTGEGGMVVTNSEDYATSLRFYRGQAQTRRRFYHDAIGYNYRFTELQAAIGIAQLQKIDSFLEKRKLVIRTYGELLKEALIYPVVVGAAPWLFTGISPLPYVMLEPELRNRGIEVRPMFVPMHRLPMYGQLDEKFPVATAICEYGISLPTYPDLTVEDVTYISTQLCESIYDLTQRRGLSRSLYESHSIPWRSTES
jgi:perosamine synthetase